MERRRTLEADLAEDLATLDDSQAAFADASADEVEHEIERAIAEVRAEDRRGPRDAATV